MRSGVLPHPLPKSRRARLRFRLSPDPRRWILSGNCFALLPIIALVSDRDVSHGPKRAVSLDASESAEESVAPGPGGFRTSKHLSHFRAEAATGFGLEIFSDPLPSKARRRKQHQLPQDRQGGDQSSARLSPDHP